MADTQFSIFKVLRPYRRFERDYHGRPGIIPISFSDSINPNDPGATSDPYAFDNQGQMIPGIGPRMIAMTKVPMGSTVLVLIPVVPGNTSELYRGGDWQYAWRFVFRIRNMADYNRDRRPYHVGKASFGAPDTTAYPAPYNSNGTNRTIIPSVSDTVVYTRPEYNSAGTYALVTNASFMEQQQVRPEAYCLSANARLEDTVANVTANLNQGMVPQPPLIPDRETGVIPSGLFGDTQQGIIDPAAAYQNRIFRSPQFYPVHIKALGDEMAIWCYKFQSSDPGGGYPAGVNWNFTPYIAHPAFTSTIAGDFFFSVMFGAGAYVGSETPTPYLESGVYLSYGKAGI